MEALAIASCAAELQERGMRRTGDGTFEVTLSPRFTGWIGLPVTSFPAPGGCSVLVKPMVGVKDEEVGRLAAALRGIAADDPAAASHCLAVKELSSLVPGRGSQPHEWLVTDSGTAEEVARRIAEDIVLSGFSYMGRAASPAAFFEEMKRSPRRFVWRHESAVTYMMHGELEESKRILRLLARPVSHNPIAWDDGDMEAVSFFGSFASYFKVDLGIESWPLREPVETNIRINVRDRGVVPQALTMIGREDLAARAALLDDAQLRLIGDRASKLYAAGNERDPGRAVGLAAVELLESE